MQNKIFHPKLRNLFTHEQLELLGDNAECHRDAKGLIHILNCDMEFGYYEIYCDCEADIMEHAIIYVYFKKTSVGKNIDSEEFWKHYNSSYPIKKEPVYSSCPLVFK